MYRRMSDVVGNYKPLLPCLKDAAIDQVNLEFAYTDTGEVDDLALLPDAFEPPTIDEAFDKLRRLADAALVLRERYA